MKLLIASDIHGDYECCKKMLSAAQKEGADKIIILGDILYHGPRNPIPQNYSPKRVIELLSTVADKLLCVRGNCDSEVDQMVLPFPIMSDTAYFYDGDSDVYMFMSHGHKYNPSALPPLTVGTVFLYGHTHVLDAQEKNGVLCLNPGSVSLPKNNNPQSYAVYCNGIFEIKDMAGATLKSIKIR